MADKASELMADDNNFDIQVNEVIGCEKTNSIKGTGTLTCKHGSSWKCKYILSQLVNGRLFLVVSVNEKISQWERLRSNLSKCEPFSLIEETNNRKVLVEHIHFTNVLILKTTLIGYARKAQVSYDFPKEADKVDTTFFITNFRFRRTMQPLEIRLANFNFAISNASLLDSSKTREHSIAYRHPIISATIQVKNVLSSDIEDLQSIVDKICWLLSISCRNHVHIVNRSLSSGEGVIRDLYEPIFFQLGHLRSLIPENSLEHFISSGFGKLTGEYEKIDLYLIADHYLQALTLHSAWAITVGIFTAMEALRAEWLKYRGEQDEEYYYWVKPEQHEKKNKEITKEIIEILSKHFPRFSDLQKNERAALKAQVGNINYRSYRTQLKRILDTLGVSYTSGEVNNFIEVRNSIIHKGYLEDKDSRKAWQRATNSVALFEKTLLAILGYSGECELFNHKETEDFEENK